MIFTWMSRAIKNAYIGDCDQPAETYFLPNNITKTMNDLTGTKRINIDDNDMLIDLCSIIRKHLSTSGKIKSPLRVFDGKPVAENELRKYFTVRDLQLLEQYGLLDYDSRQFSSQFAAHLIDNMLIFTDPDVPDDRQADTYLDPLWDKFLSKLLYRGSVSYSLDMGCGCGFLSLIMSSYSENVVGVDINPRAINISNANAAINGIKNVKFILGDMFGPVKHQGFDRIVFNSPTDFEGFEQKRWLEAGEGILERFFSEVTTSLNHAGFCQVSLAMNDYKNSRFYDRLQSWLGPLHSSYQILILILAKRKLESGAKWKRGWLNLRRGTGYIKEIAFKYDMLPLSIGNDAVWTVLKEIMDAPDNYGDFCPELDRLLL